MKHPHDVMGQMDQSDFGHIRKSWDDLKIFADGSAMLERAWPYRRTSEAWGAVFVETNSQGLDALVGFLEDVEQVHPQHPQCLSARAKTTTAAELSAIITTLATVWRVSRPPELHFFSSEFSITELQRQCRPCSNVELIQCGRALVDEARCTTQVAFQHVEGHSGLRLNGMADWIADAARKGVKIGATAPCFRSSAAGQVHDQEQAGPMDRRLTQSISSEQVCFWFDVARCPETKSVSHKKEQQMFNC